MFVNFKRVFFWPTQMLDEVGEQAEKKYLQDFHLVWEVRRGAQQKHKWTLVLVTADLPRPLQGVEWALKGREFLFQWVGQQVIIPNYEDSLRMAEATVHLDRDNNNDIVFSITVLFLSIRWSPVFPGPTCEIWQTVWTITSFSNIWFLYIYR